MLYLYHQRKGDLLMNYIVVASEKKTGKKKWIGHGVWKRAMTARGYANRWNDYAEKHPRLRFNADHVVIALPEGMKPIVVNIEKFVETL